MIDYNILGSSVTHYESHGYKRIESPWTVSPYIDDITRPENATPYELVHNGKRLVASGEQSFLYLYLKNFIPKGKYQTITPCFRFENFDYLHTKYFIKNELMITDEVNSNKLDEMIEHALQFFGYHIHRDKLNVIKTEIGYDIEYKDIELGSYGIRECEFLNWIYGTGCAEPRLSNVTKCGYEL